MHADCILQHQLYSDVGFPRGSLYNKTSGASSAIQAFIIPPVQRFHTVLACTPAIGGPPFVDSGSFVAPTKVLAIVPDPMVYHASSAVSMSFFLIFGAGCLSMLFGDLF